jgi:hypothetical protein
MEQRMQATMTEASERMATPSVRFSSIYFATQLAARCASSAPAAARWQSGAMDFELSFMRQSA